MSTPESVCTEPSLVALYEDDAGTTAPEDDATYAFVLCFVTSQVFIIDVDESSPRFGERWPAEVTFYPDGGRYFTSNILVVQPPMTIPLWPGTRYAAVVVRDVIDAEGRLVAPTPAFEKLLANSPPSGRKRE